MINYLRALEMSPYPPNWWCSVEYAKHAGWVSYRDDDDRLTMMIDSDVMSDSEYMLPPLVKFNDGFATWSRLIPPGGVWSSFANMELEYGVDLQKTFLDLEFIYDPKLFLDLSGGKWSTFRKNIGKFRRRNDRFDFEYRWATPSDDNQIRKLIELWIGEKDEIEDGGALINFTLDGWTRKILVDEIGNIWALNVWDENYKFINYRYSIVDPDRKYLDEYNRWLFYTDPLIQSRGKLVNDGGCLGNEGLKRFKMKLNPIRVNEIFSWAVK